MINHLEEFITECALSLFLRMGLATTPVPAWMAMRVTIVRLKSTSAFQTPATTLECARSADGFACMQ